MDGGARAMSGEEFFRELPRKIFHVLSLLYYAAYLFLGPERAVWGMAAWTITVAVGEAARLFWPALNCRLMRLFSGVARAEEQTRVSGIFHTTLGAFLVIFIFGKYPRTVAFALSCAALGDAAAALGGKALGRRVLIDGKTIEGSLSCLSVCFLIGLLLGLGWVPSFLASAATTVLELAPSTTYFNDNLWMPLIAAGVLHLTTRK